jgi:uncharacterized membrane protein
MTIIAMLTALIIILVYTPLGMITIGPISTTFAHIPVIIGLLAEGPLVGLILAFVFGLASMIRAYIAPTGILSLFFQDPLVAILPRMLFPLAAWGVTLLLRKLLNDTKAMRRLNWAITGLFASLMHTVFVLYALYLLHAQGLIEKINESNLGQYLNAPGRLLFYAVALPNGIPEALVTMILTPAILTAVMAIKKHR